MPPASPHVLHRDRAGLATWPPGSDLAPRVLHADELLLVLTGGARWTGDGRTIDLVPGSLLLTRAGGPEHWTWHPTTPTRHVYVHFTPAVPAPDRAPLVHHEPQPGILGALFRQLVRLDARPDRDAPGVREVADLTFALLLRTALAGLGGAAEAGPDLPAPLAAAVAHVRRRWSGGVLEPVPVAELARAGAVAPGTLTRAFRRHLGVAPAAGLEGVRLARAVALLRTTAAPLRTVAALCGFADAFHLSHRCRAVLGAPPTAVRDRAAPAPELPAAVRRLEALVLGAP